jgi:hypothetical protein
MSAGFLSVHDFSQISLIENPLQLLYLAAVVCFGEFIDIVGG